MHVDAPVFRQVQHGLRKKHAVGDHDNQVRLQRGQLLLRLRVAERARLKNRQTDGLRILLDLGGNQLHAAVFRRVGLGIDGGKLKARLIQPLQAYAGNVRRAHKNKSHASSSSSCC